MLKLTAAPNLPFNISHVTRRMMQPTVNWTVLFSLLAGCASTEYRLNSGAQRPAFGRVVLVYRQTIPAGVDYSVIGDFVAQKQFYGGTAETANAVKSEASARGANGILIERSGHRPAGWSWASPFTEGKLLWIKNYEAASAAQSGAALGSPRLSSNAERLKELDDLHRRGLVTDAEFEDKRKVLVEGL
jgi:hypothetical protein